MTMIVPDALDRRDYSPPFVGYCPRYETWRTIEEWRMHPLRQRFCLFVCIDCSEAAGHVCEHAVELLESRQ